MFCMEQKYASLKTHSPRVGVRNTCNNLLLKFPILFLGMGNFNYWVMSQK